MLCQRHRRSHHRGFKKKSTNPAVIITESAKGGIDPVSPKSQATAVPASRPAAAQPRPISDKESIVKKSSKLISLDNIHEHSRKKQADDAGDNFGPGPLIREFNHDNVIQLWHTFSASIRDTKGGISVLMEAILPVVTEATITIGFNSDVQKGKFNEVLIQYKNFIHRHFGFNPHIVIEVEQTVGNTQKYYTPKDKLERLMELYPALRRFQKELGLDLDYD